MTVIEKRVIVVDGIEHVLSKVDWSVTIDEAIQDGIIKQDKHGDIHEEIIQYIVEGI